MSSDENKMPEEENSIEKSSSGEDNEKENFRVLEEYEEENVSDELRYWQEYFAAEEDEFTSRSKKKVKKKGKYKDSDFD